MATMLSSLELSLSVEGSRATATAKGQFVNLNNTIAFPIKDLAANELGTYIITAPKIKATVNAGTYNAGTPVYINLATPAKVQATGGGGFRCIGTCIKNYGALPLNAEIEMTFNGTQPKGN